MPGPSNVALGSVQFSFVVAVPTNAAFVANVLTITTAERTLSVPGVLVGDIITVNKPSHQTGLGIVNARASAADTVAITFMNVTAGSIAPTAETYLIQIDRHSYPSLAQIPPAIA